MKRFPSAKEILEEAKAQKPKADINQLHALTFKLMMKYKDTYYKDKVGEFLCRNSLANLPEETKLKIKQEIHISVDAYLGREGFMEETSRRISQTFQPISGNLAELCAEKELIDIGLKLGINYKKRVEHTDLIIYHPQLSGYSKKHRVEVKNVSVRERATRGFIFDGDSMIGFFNDPGEFTNTNIDIIDEQCQKTGGYCYIPPVILERIRDKTQNKRFKPNTDFVSDMEKFVKTGII